MIRKISVTLLILTTIVLFALACENVRQVKRLTGKKDTPVAGATKIGTSTCLECHGDKLSHWDSKGNSQCEDCHGPGSKHADVDNSDKAGKARTIAYLPGKKMTKTCLKCHLRGKTAQTTWSTALHKKAGVQCAECHKMHRKERKTYRQPKNIVAMCTSCHVQRKGDMRKPYRHPMAGYGEGAMSCADCHEPHGDKNISMTKVNERCLKCHKEKRGPWTFEHPPVTDDCTICHNPHGSVNKGMLKVSQPYLCLRCHSLADGEHIAAKQSFTECTACHFNIHGGHQDQHFRR